MVKRNALTLLFPSDRLVAICVFTASSLSILAFAMFSKSFFHLQFALLSVDWCQRCRARHWRWSCCSKTRWYHRYSGWTSGLVPCIIAILGLALSSRSSASFDVFVALTAAMDLGWQCCRTWNSGLKMGCLYRCCRISTMDSLEPSWLGPTPFGLTFHWWLQIAF